MTYQESLDWLYGLQVHGIQLGLENMKRLCAALGIETECGEKRKFIHVAGTNGKGSVCAMLAAILCAEGKRTGLYTSPHLIHFRERIRLGASCIPDEHIAEGLTEIRRFIENWDHSPTFFEITTALALSWFQRQRAEWIVLETGLGGRLDATNVITPLVSVITPIGLDHTQYLGPTLTDVAREKAGIIKRLVPVLSAPQQDEVIHVLRNAASEMGAPLKFITNPIAESWQLALTGSHQRWNAALAFAALVAAGLRPKPRTVAQALANTEWPGRFQRVGEKLILDGAHNPAAATQLATTWREQFGDQRATLIIGILADKDVPATIQPLLSIAARVYCVPVKNPRTLAAETLAGQVAKISSQTPCSVFADAATAISAAEQHDGLALVAGSLFLIGEVLSPDAQEKSAQ